MPIKNKLKKLPFAFISSRVYFILGLNQRQRGGVCALESPSPGVSVIAVFQDTASKDCFPLLADLQQTAEMNTSSSASNRASTVFSMCQEMRSNDYKLHNYIPSLSSLSLNHGSLWCKYKLLHVLFFSECILHSSLVWPLKSVITKGWGNSEDLLSMRASHCKTVPMNEPKLPLNLSHRDLWA